MLRKSFLFFIFACFTTLAVNSAVYAQMAPLNGTVVLEKDGKTEPVAGAVVDVFRTDVKGFYTQKTDKKGEFRFAGILYGEYLISVSAPNCAPIVYPDIRAGQEGLKIVMYPGDGKKFTEAEAKKGATSVTKNNGSDSGVSEEERKAQAELEKRNAEIKAKNEKTQAADAIAAKSNTEGKAALDANNYDLAIEKYSEGIAAVPDYVGSTPILINGKMEALKLKGYAIYKQGATTTDLAVRTEKYTEATRLFDEALASFQQALGIIKAAGSATDAVEQKRREHLTLSLYSIAAEVHRLRSITSSDGSKTGEANAVFAEYIAMLVEPEKKIDVTMKLGDMMRRIGDFEKAVEAYRQVLAIKPDHAEATGQLGLSLFGLGTSIGDKTKEQEGLNYMQKYIEMSPISPTDSQQIKELKESIKQAVDYLKNEQKMAPQKVTTPAKKKN